MLVIFEESTEISYYYYHAWVTRVDVEMLVFMCLWIGKWTDGRGMIAV
jgi:hypothetical protein